MPYNINKKPIKLPVKLKTGEEPVTGYTEQLSSIRVQLMYAPTMTELGSYIPEFCTATWQDRPPLHRDYTFQERNKILHDLFHGKFLPTAMETINITFRIEGMDIIDTTHLIRHRMFSFSAQCSADRDLRHDSAVVKPGILANEKFMDRYMEITEAAKQLYADMVDSGEISILDARTILPRNLATFYYVRGTLGDWIRYVEQRKDEQIQPMSDNVIAMYIWLELVRMYPPLINRVKIGGPDHWYIKTAPTGRNSNIYPPKPENDTFEYGDNWFLHDKPRDGFEGSEVYSAIKNRVLRILDEYRQKYERIYGQNSVRPE